MVINPLRSSISSRYAPKALIMASVVLATCAVGASQAQTWTQPGTGSWADPLNWTPNTVPNAVGAAVVFNSPDATRTISVNSAPATFTLGSLTSTNNAATALTTTINTGTAGSTLTFDNSGAGPATVTVDGSGLGNTTLSAASIFVDTVVATVFSISATSGAGALNWTGTVTGGAGGFTKKGPGILTFGTGGKRYTGPTLFDTDSGRTRISVAGSPTDTSSFTVNPGAQITLITAGTYTLGSGSVFLNGTGLGPGSYPGNFPGAIRNDTNLVATISNPVVLQTDTLIHVQGTSGSTTLSNTVSGPGRLTLTAPFSDANLGTLVLNGANTYSGGTTVNGGTLLVGGTSTASLGSGDVTINSANSMFPGAIARLTIQTGVTNAIADTATLSLVGGGAAGVADDGYVDLGAGVNEILGGLVLGGFSQPIGTYGSTSSAATFKNDEYFSGSGILTVVPEPNAAATLLAGAILLAGRRRPFRE